jgi:hypothetical protein
VTRATAEPRSAIETATAYIEPCHRRVVWRAITVWLALAVSAGEARAERGFVWAAPAPCPDAADVRARIERRLGMPVDGSVHGIEVAIAREGGGFVARIDTRGVTLANQIRTLTSARCDELADAVAVVVARLATEARARQAEARARSTAIPIAAAAVPPARREPGPWGGGVRAIAVSGVGVLPGVGVAGELAVYVRRRAYFGELAGTRWVPNAKYLADGAPGAVDVSLLAVALRAGWSPPDKYIRAWAVAEGGPMTGEGIALNDPRIGSGRWTGAGAGFGVIWPMLDRLRLVGSVEFLATFEQVRFVLADGTEVYRPSVGVARCALGLEFGWR